MLAYFTTAGLAEAQLVHGVAGDLLRTRARAEQAAKGELGMGSAVEAGGGGRRRARRRGMPEGGHVDGDRTVTQ